MKRKIIFIEVSLLFIFAVLLAVFVPSVQQATLWFGDISWNIQQGFSPHYLSYQYAYKSLTYSIISFLAMIADIAVLSIIAIQNFKVFQPLIDKHNARKQERAAARQAKEEERKQKRIESLETELQELKKDDNAPSD